MFDAATDAQRLENLRKYRRQQAVHAEAVWLITLANRGCGSWCASACADLWDCVTVPAHIKDALLEFERTHPSETEDTGDDDALGISAALAFRELVAGEIRRLVAVAD